MSKYGKSVSGPLTTAVDDAPGVVIKFPDESLLSLVLEKLSESVVTRLAVHGLSQKLGDSFAGAASEENPLTYAKERVAAVIKQLTDGEWRVTGAGGPRVTLLARALARATGQTLEAAIEVLTEKEAELDNEETKKADNPWKQWQANLRSQPAVKKATSDIKLEDATKAAAAAPDAKTQQADLGALFSS